MENEHVCKLRESTEFQEDSFTRDERTINDKPVSVVIGRLKEGGEVADYEVHYPSDAWTEDEAGSDCSSHNGINFKAAGLEEKTEEPAQKPEESSQQ